MNDYIKELKIGNVKIKNNIILAPMAGITDYPFRLLSLIFGVGLTVSEMVNVTGMHYKSKLTPTLIKRAEGERPFSIQLFGNNADHFATSVRFIAENKLSEIIDINMGCPAKNVTSSKSGVYLMKDIENAKKIVKSAVAAAAEYNPAPPVTVKIRLGWDLNSIIAPDFCRMLEDLGVSMITVHGRTYSMMFSGTPLYKYIAECKKAVKVPVIANGDINLYESIKNVIDITGTDGVMIGRAAMGRPWIFKDILNAAENKNGLHFQIPDMIKLMKIHSKLVEEFYRDISGIVTIRKHLLWYTRGWHQGAQLREKLKLAESTEHIEQMLSEYLSSSKFVDIPENRVFNVYSHSPQQIETV